MLIAAGQRSWFLATLGAAFVSTLAYVAYVATSPYGPSGGSWPGLAFGILGTAAMIVAGLLGARKKLRTVRLGSARRWMQAHVWLGLLAVPWILFHAGFQLGGPLTTWIMVLFAVVTASGLLGLALQQFLPAAMRRALPAETLIGQLDHVAADLATEAYEIVASLIGTLEEAAEERAALEAEEKLLQVRPSYWKAHPRQRPAQEPIEGTEPLRQCYLEEVRPYLRRSRLRSGTPPRLRDLVVEAPQEWRGKIERLREICDESRQLGVQERLHTALHQWLLIHAPLSFALFVLIAFHACIALRY